MTRAAALILAAKAPDNFQALAGFLDRSGIDSFVHVDAKFDAEPFRIACRDNASTTFLSDRVAVYWRGFTMVEATMRLIIAARSTRSYDRYLLLSDDALPALPGSQIKDRLVDDIDFIDTKATEAARWRYDGYFMFDSEATTLRGRSIKDRSFTSEAIDRIGRMGTLRRTGKKPLSEIYHGSQWWCLRAGTIEKVLESWSSDDWLRDSFTYSECSDEGYIQTIVGMASGNIRRHFMYVEWNHNGPDNPRIFRSVADLRSVRLTTQLFVRKCDLPLVEALSYTRFEPEQIQNG